MDFNQYQKLAAITMNKGVEGNQAVSNYALGLGGESGEVLNKIKKFIFHGQDTSETYNAIMDEMGDVLWYLAALAESYHMSLDAIAEHNIQKLSERYPDGFKKAGENE